MRVGITIDRGAAAGAGAARVRTNRGSGTSSVRGERGSSRPKYA